MRSRIRYEPEQIELDLSKPDLGHPHGHEILARHYRQSDWPHPAYNRKNPAFTCITHKGGTNPGLFLKKIGDHWWAVHYERGNCKAVRLPAPMTDEHKRQTEYWIRAAEDAGWTTERERRLSTGTQPDAIIHGPVVTGVEVQLYEMGAAHAIDRTRKAQQAGVTDIWFTSSDIQTLGRRHEPRWAYRVPTVGAYRIPWGVLPPRRAATATGLRKIQPTRCVVANFDRCPYFTGRGRSYCGRVHPKPEPWIGLTVDDVAAMFPAGEIVAVTFDCYQGQDDVLLIPATEVPTYEDLTGQPARLAFASDEGPHASGRSADRVECRNPQPAARQAADLEPLPRRPGSCNSPGCENPARLYAGGWRCEQHLPLPFVSDVLGKLPG